jgi:hypothetical protein
MARIKKAAPKPKKKPARPKPRPARSGTKTMQRSTRPAKGKVGKKKKSIRYRSPLAKKPKLPKTLRFKWVRHPLDGRGVKFRVPTSWKYTWGSEDNSLYYPQVPDVAGPSPIGGRLFVRFRLEPVQHANDGAAYGLLMSHRTDPSQTVTQLDSGAFLLHFKTNHSTEGYHAVDYFWFLALPMPPRRIALASFLFSGIAELFDGSQAPERSIVKMLEEELPKAKFDEEVLPVEIENA